MSAPAGLAVLGSTGSVGQSTLAVVRDNPAQFRVIALTASRDGDRLLQQCQEHRPQYAVLVDEAAARRLEEVVALPAVDRVMAAIVGAAGLLPTMAAARAGKQVLLANKESLVMAGGLLMQAVQEGGGSLLPIDSEHNAILQCLPGSGPRTAGVSRLVLTASGGPFLDHPLESLAAVTPEEACAHPTWEMGRKISVDSATMMNKGLEIIEACWLFAMPPEKIDVLVHPQSIVHSLVEYEDGSVLAQMGCPDMRIPIAHALGWPARIASGAPRLDLRRERPLEFRGACEQRFPCLALARRAAADPGSLPAVLNAANEEAVEAFLERRLAFTDIARVVARVLDESESQPMTDLDQVLAADAAARQRARRCIDRFGATP